MTQSVPELVVVLLCVIGAGAVVTACAAFGMSFYGRHQVQTDFNQRSAEQDAYMARVRERNQAAVWGIARSQRKADRRHRNRDIEASEFDIRSGRSHSNAGLHGSHGYGYHTGGRRTPGYSQSHTPTPYYEEDEYTGPNQAPGAYDEQQYQEQYQQQQHPQQTTYTSAQADLYASHQSKSGATQTWNEV